MEGGGDLEFIIKKIIKLVILGLMLSCLTILISWIVGVRNSTTLSDILFIVGSITGLMGVASVFSSNKRVNSYRERTVTSFTEGGINKSNSNRFNEMWDSFSILINSLIVAAVMIMSCIIVGKK